MLAFCESFVPTILLSALPLTVHPSVYGAAFGMAEVRGAVVAFVAVVPVVNCYCWCCRHRDTHIFGVLTVLPQNVLSVDPTRRKTAAPSPQYPLPAVFCLFV